MVISSHLIAAAGQWSTLNKESQICGEFLELQDVIATESSSIEPSPNRRSAGTLDLKIVRSMSFVQRL